jgi:hypothetical protein
MSLLRNKKVLLKPILKKFGKLRKPSLSLEEYLVSKAKESWGYNGTKDRFKTIFFEHLQKKPFRFLIKLRKEKPNVMFLGAGKGEALYQFIKFSSKLKLNPIVDVFSFTKSLTKDVKSLVNKDYSSRTLFEHLNVKKSKFKFLENRYDLVVGAMSVGEHTYYPANAIFTSSLMLLKNGKAYIEVEDLRDRFTVKEYDAYISYLKKFPKQHHDELYYQKQIDNLKIIFKRMVYSYNPKLEFSFKIIKNPKTAINFVEIERIK